ncbi:hypothetical protein EC991_002424 [Linnemannia zychae]|nr:hypothetical protein EC991_002424 [Linnemannia zychae]
MSTYLTAISSGEEPLEFTKTAPILDPKIPFFKYLDMLASISKDALSLRQQAYEIFLALNPHLSYASGSISDGASTQPPVKLNRKAEILLNSSMILFQRYCIILQVSLPKLPSFRRRTHTNTLKAYDIRAVGYQDDLAQYQEEGALLFLLSCFDRSKAVQQGMSKLTPSQRAFGALPMDAHTIAKGPLASFKAAKSTERLSENDLSRAKDHAAVPVAITGVTSTSAITPTRRASRRKKWSAETQIKVEVSPLTTDNPAVALPGSIPLTESALWKWERDLEKLREVGVIMEEQIAQSAHIRTNSKSTTPAAPPIAIPTLARPTIAAVSHLPAIAHPTLNASTISADSAKLTKSKTCGNSTVAPAGPTPPAMIPSTMAKPLATRAIFTPVPPTVTKSTTKRISPATGAIRGSGVVRNLIRQYETPSSSSSTSSKGDRPDILTARKMKPVAAVTCINTTSSATSAAEKKGTATTKVTVAPAKKSSKIGHVASTTNTTTNTTANKIPKAMEMAAPTTASRLYPRRGTSPDLGDKESIPAHAASPTAKARTIKEPVRNLRSSLTAPTPVRHNPSGRSLATAPSTQTTKTRDDKRTSSSHTDGQVKDSTLSGSSCPRLDLWTTSSSSGLVTPSIQPADIVSSNSTNGAKSPRKGSTGKQIALDISAQGCQTHTKPSLSAGSLSNNPPPLLSQLQKIPSTSVNTAATSSSIATAFRDGARSKPLAALGSLTFAHSNSLLENAQVVAEASEVNISNLGIQSNAGSTSSKFMSSDESIRSWRRSVPTGVSTGASSSYPLDSVSFTMHQSRQSSSTPPSIAEVGTTDYKNGDGDYEEDDDKSHIDLIRIPTVSSIRSSATTSTTRTHSFSATSPLGSARFKPHKRPSFRNALIHETKIEGKRTVDVMEVNEKNPGYIPESDESDTETENLQYLEVPATRSTQSWLDMRTQELEQEKKMTLLEEGDNANRSEGDSEEEAGASQMAKTRHDSKYSTMTIPGNETNSQRRTTASRLSLSQVRFGKQSSSQSQEEIQHIQSTQMKGKRELDEAISSPLRGRPPSFTEPFKPEQQRVEYQPPLISNSGGYRQNGLRSLRHYASTVSSSSTCTVRQPTPSHSVSPASSAFATLRATASESSSIAPSVKSFATGSTVTLRTPKFYPPSTFTASTANTSTRSFFPAQGQTDDGGATTNTTSSPNISRICAREVLVLGSLSEPVLASKPRQMNGKLVWIQAEDTDDSLRQSDDVGQSLKRLHDYVLVCGGESE